MKSAKRTRAGRGVLLVVASVVVATTVLAGTGAAAKSNLYYVNVGAAAFVPQSSSIVCDYNHDGYSGELTTPASDQPVRLQPQPGTCDFVAHIDLPDGMKIGSITAYYNNGDGDASFRFEANDDVGGHVDLVDDDLDGSAGDDGGAVCDGSSNCHAIWDLNNTVNNNTTHYGIYLNVDAGFILYRFKIKLK
jgi:hypothetical protein